MPAGSGTAEALAVPVTEAVKLDRLVPVMPTGGVTFEKLNDKPIGAPSSDVGMTLEVKITNSPAAEPTEMVRLGPAPNAASVNEPLR